MLAGSVTMSRHTTDVATLLLSPEAHLDVALVGVVTHGLRFPRGDLLDLIVGLRK